jgi:hypothetical protein
MNYTNEVKEKLATLESRGYEKHINPNTKQIQMRKNCQLKVDKFLSTDEEGAIKWSVRKDSDVESTLVHCSLSNHPDFDVKATLYRTSWEQNACVIGSVYSATATCTVTEKGTNALNPTCDNTFFTLFTSIGVVVSSDELSKVGL